MFDDNTQMSGHDNIYLLSVVQNKLNLRSFLTKSDKVHVIKLWSTNKETFTSGFSLYTMYMQ